MNDAVPTTIRMGAKLKLSVTGPLSDDSDTAITLLMDEAESRRCVDLMRSDLDRADESISSFRQRALDWKEREGWKALGYGGFIEGIQGEFGAQWSKSYLSRLVKAAEIERALELPIGNAVPESHLRPLAALDSPDDRRAAFDRAADLAGDGKRTARHVQQAVREMHPDPLPFDDDLEPERGERWTSTAHKAAEDNDRTLLIRAEQEIASGDYATARGLLDQVGDTSSRARDRLLERLPVAHDARANWLEMGVTVMGAPFMAAFYASADHILAMLSDDPRVDDTAYAALSHAIGTARRVLEEA